jgi:hypothetical protein
MSVIWLNGTVGSGKTSVGKVLVKLLAGARFMDGDDCAGPEHLPNFMRWRAAVNALLQAVVRPGRYSTLVIAYPLDFLSFRRLEATCRRAHRSLLVVNLASPLAMTLRGRGGRTLSPSERERVRVMRSEGYHRRPFAAVSLPNAYPPVERTARKIACLRNSLAAPA